jgi:uncharacterized membrane protein YedE/YeeE
MATTSHPWRSFDKPDESVRPASDASAPQDARAWPWVEGGARTLALALVSGSIFGFLLQKGGVAKYDILMGALLLTNTVVFKVMLSAIIVGMIGVYVLERFGALKTQISETAYTSNIVGSLLFGLGFGLLAYCPGTDAAAVGQGNFDALVGVAGLVVGSYVFALMTRAKPNLSSLGARGKLTLPDVLHMSRGRAVAIFAPLLVFALVLIEMFAP